MQASAGVAQRESHGPFLGEWLAFNNKAAPDPFKPELLRAVVPPDPLSTTPGPTIEGYHRAKASQARTVSRAAFSSTNRVVAEADAKAVLRNPMDLGDLNHRRRSACCARAGALRPGIWSERLSAFAHGLHDFVCHQILNMFWKNDTSQLPAPR